MSASLGNPPPEASARPSWLDDLNAASEESVVREQLLACCAATGYAERMLAGRPYADVDSLLRHSDAAVEALDAAGLAEALAAHPRIGERAEGAEARWSRQEQSGVASADADVLDQLREANLAYEERFGQVYLVCATGRTADEMLAICRGRLGNDKQTERQVVLGELAKITRLRLGKLLAPADQP